MLKALVRSRPVQETLGRFLAWYLESVRKTNRVTLEPADAYDRVGPMMPVIVAMWHGQHFMMHFARPEGVPAAGLISRHGDGEFNAIALRHLGVEPIRGSGALGRKVREKGGAAALRAMARALQRGSMVVLTADVPKRARVCGMGIVTLARMTGRPIVPTAVVASRRIQFNSWDKASVGLPFGRSAVVIGEAILVDREASEEAMEAARLAVERGLDEAHARAYALVGGSDPGAGLRAAASTAGRP